MSAVFDIYLIGDRCGFYVGQAKRHPKLGGWQRRIEQHRRRTKRASRHAGDLLAAGAQAQLVGSFESSRAHACVIEARAWDHYRALGWEPVHQRPRAGNYVGANGKIRTARHRARLSAVNKGKVVSEETKKKISDALIARYASGVRHPRQGKTFSNESRDKMRAALQGRHLTAEHKERVGAGLRGRRFTDEHRARISAAFKGRRRDANLRWLG